MKTLLISVLIITLSASISNGQLAPDTLWTKKIDHSVGFALQTQDEGLLLLGDAQSGKYIICCDDSGNILWERSFSICPGYRPHYSFAVETEDHGFVIGCCCASGRLEVFYYDHRLIKLNSAGDSVWISTNSEGEGDFIRWIEQTSDKGYITTGNSEYSARKGTTRNYNDNGDILWTKDYGGCSVLETSDNGFLIAGSNSYEEGFGDVTLLKTNDLGDSLWMKTYKKDEFCKALSIQIIRTSDGGYMILSGFNYLEPNYPYTWLIKTNESGDTTWTRNFHEQYNYIQQTTDNGYIMIGFKDNEDLYIVKLNVRGENQWIKIMNDYRGIYDCRGLYIGQTSDHGYLGVAKTDNEYTTLIRLGKDPLLAVKENNLLPLYYKMSQNYPNPFNPSTTIKFDLPKTSDVRLEVYNLAGQIVQTIINKKIPAGSHQVEFNAHNLSSGVYYYRIHVGEFQDVKKMILLR